MIGGTPPSTPPAGFEDGGLGICPEAEGEAASALESQEIVVRKLSLRAAGSMTEEPDGDESKPHEETGSAESEQVTTETDGEEGMARSVDFSAVTSSLRLQLHMSTPAEYVETQELYWDKILSLCLSVPRHACQRSPCSVASIRTA